MINKPPSFYGPIYIGIPIILPIRGRGSINQGCTLWECIVPVYGRHHGKGVRSVFSRTRGMSRNLCPFTYTCRGHKCLSHPISLNGASEAHIFVEFPIILTTRELIIFLGPKDLHFVSMAAELVSFKVCG